MNFKIDNIKYHTNIKPDQIAAITYVASNSSRSGNEGVMLLRHQKRHDGSIMETIIATYGRHVTDDVRSSKRNVQAAYCRLTGTTNAKMRKLSADWQANEQVQERATNVECLKVLAKRYGIVIHIEE